MLLKYIFTNLISRYINNKLSFMPGFKIITDVNTDNNTNTTNNTLSNTNTLNNTNKNNNITLPTQINLTNPI